MEKMKELIMLAREMLQCDKEDNPHYTDEHGEKVSKVIDEAEEELKRWFSDTNGKRTND